MHNPNKDPLMMPPETTLHLHPDAQIHFIGIGGSGMNPIAHFLVSQGFTITGTDQSESSGVISLLEKGAKIKIGHQDMSLIHQASMVVYSSAIPDSNLELCYAKSHSIPLFHRSEILNLLFNTSHNRIAVAGSHGKTTTSAMISHVLNTAHQNPNFVIGGTLQSSNRNYQCGKSSFFIIEADESDGSFLTFTPTAAIILNIGKDHLSFFNSVENLHHHFKQFIQAIIDRNGVVFLNADDSICMRLIPDHLAHQIHFYSIHAQRGTFATHIHADEHGTTFKVHTTTNDTPLFLGEISIPTYGKHNVANALSVISCLRYHDISFSDIKSGLATYEGTHRRMSHIGTTQSITIYDDYAHHPIEIKSTLSGLKSSFNRKVICIFQPHRYSRLHDFFEEFITAFSQADILILTDVYSAGESPFGDVDSAKLFKKIQAIHSGKVIYIPNLKNIPHQLTDILTSGDIVVTMGAGNIHTVANAVFNLLHAT